MRTCRVFAQTVTFTSKDGNRQVSTLPVAAGQAVPVEVAILLGQYTFQFIMYGHNSGMSYIQGTLILIHQWWSTKCRHLDHTLSVVMHDTFVMSGIQPIV